MIFDGDDNDERIESSFKHQPKERKCQWIKGKRKCQWIKR